MEEHAIDVQHEDQRPATWQHIHTVRELMTECVTRLLGRALVHDQSKLHEPEASVFDEYTPRLSGLTYGSPEYRECLLGMKPALDHHYAHNSHHPEHYELGVDGMCLLDVLEMLCDWKAATLRHDDGDLDKSIAHNVVRFGISTQVESLLRNTASRMGWL